MKTAFDIETRFARYAVPRLTLLLLLGQVLFFAAGAFNPDSLAYMVLDSSLVRQGEIWRLVTFLFLPPRTHPLFLLFAWYLFYLMGTALETHWGHVRYNLFIFLGWSLTAAVSFLSPGRAMTNAFLGGSVFLAFAWLYPDFQILLFFIVPVPIKWLALLTWIGYGYHFVVSHWSERLAILAAVGNFLLFFGSDLLARLRNELRPTRPLPGVSSPSLPRHRCRRCGITERSHPEMDFRYCTDCHPPQCYCRDHLDQHEHVNEKPD